MKCVTPVQVKHGKSFILVPCGRCPPCKHRRVNEWVFRMKKEEERSSSSHFITLTYDTDHVPISPNGYMTLRKKDFQDFMKRLRKAVSVDYPEARIKYYAVGEYGTQNKRPHYHAIIFNVPDTQYFPDAWSLGGVMIGGVHVGQVTSDSIAYTMKYIDKAGFEKRHSRDDREKEQPLMSKGLGDNYLTDEVRKYHLSDITGHMCLTTTGGGRISMPRYYRTRIYDEQQRSMQVDYIQRIEGENEKQKYLDFKRQFADRPYYDYLHHLESIRKEAFRKLKNDKTRKL